MKIFGLILLVMIFISLSSCSVTSPEPELDLDPIESRVIFSVTYDSTHIMYDHTGYLLMLKTEKIYGCANYEIISKLKFTSDKISVEMYGIDRGGMCATAKGPAMKLIPLEIKDGVFILDLSYEGVTDKYSLKVVDKSVIIDFVDSDFTIYQVYNFFF
jgi:hypothetical protein